MIPPSSASGRPPGWADSLFTGAAGVALLHVERAHAGTAGWDTAHAWAAVMARGPVTANPAVSGLHRGAPAVAYVLHRAGQPGYAAALDTLDHHVTDLTVQRLTWAHARIDTGHLPALAEFDLIRGLTGIGVYLLARRRNDELLSAVLSYLVRLTEPLSHNGGTLPGWWTGHAPNDRPSVHWPGGHANLGLAHGISGPLAMLSLALRHGVSVPGQATAIIRICSWLDRWSVPGDNADRGTVWWPETITGAELRAGSSRQAGPGRPSWCYGTPGIARAQQLAGHALADPDRRRKAEHALAACLHDDGQLDRIREATVCHGWAGLAMTTWRTAAEAIDPDRFPLRAIRARLEAHLRQHGRPEGDSLLDGSTGVDLAELALAAQHPNRSPWDSCLLLVGDDAQAPGQPPPARPTQSIRGDS